MEPNDGENSTEGGGRSRTICCSATAPNARRFGASVHQTSRQRARLSFNVRSCFVRRHMVPHCQHTYRSQRGGADASTPPISSRCGRTSADAPTNAAQCLQIIIASDDVPYLRRSCVVLVRIEAFPVRVTSPASELGKQSIGTQCCALAEQHLVRLDRGRLTVEVAAAKAHGNLSFLISQERLATGRPSRRGSSTPTAELRVFDRPSALR